MKYKGTLIAVKNMEKAKVFYQSLLGLDILLDAGANVALTSGVFLQTVETWSHFIHKPKPDIIFSNHAIELYFETNDMDGFGEKLMAFPEIEYIHPLMEHSWGQRAVRFYDLDHHIIEVAEDISMVIRRYMSSGLTIEQTAKRMDVNTDYIQSVLAQAD